MNQKYYKAVITIVALVIITAMIVAAYYGGKRVADREAALKELRVERQQLQNELAELKKQRPEISKETEKLVEATRSNRAHIDTIEGRISDAEANIGIHLRPVPSDPTASMSDAPSVVIEQKELPLLTDYITNFKAQTIEFAGCKKELANCDAQVKNLEQQNANLDGQVKIEAKKHGFWGKAKAFLIGGAIGAAAGYVASR